MDEADNIITFPIVNRRHDVTSIPLDPEEVAEKIKLMKLAYFSEVANAIVDDTLRSISMLSIEDTKAETFDVQSRDIILIKEAVISTLCRIVGIEHPLHEIGDDNIIISETIEDIESSLLNYRFKTDPNLPNEESVES